jgi:UDP-glucose:(heptosyl)LPS alpha-1,3-glucosyltransferase
MGMKIAYLFPGYLSPTTGAGITLWSLAEFISRHHQVEIFTDAWDKRVPSRIGMHRLPSIHIRSRGKADFFFPARILTKYLASTRLSNRLAPEFDIIHIYNGIGACPSLLVTELMCQKAVMEERKKESLKSFLSQHTPKHLLLRFLEGHVYRRHLFRKLIPASEFEKEQILKYYRVTPSDIIPVHGGVDYEAFNPPDKERRRKALREKYGYSPRDVVCLFVGYDFRRKGLKYLLRALPLIDEKMKLLAVGGVGSLPEYRKIASELGVEERVTFTGPVYENSRDFFYAADLFIFPTLFDPFGTVVVEAMAAGLPVITSRRVGAAELITPGKDGLLLEDPKDGREIARLADSLLEKSTADEVGAAARVTARGCTWEAKAEELVSVYEKLA